MRFLCSNCLWVVFPQKNWQELCLRESARRWETESRWWQGPKTLVSHPREVGQWVGFKMQCRREALHWNLRTLSLADKWKTRSSQVQDSSPVSGTLRCGVEETSSKLSLRLGAKESRSQERDAAWKIEGNIQRWPSIIGSRLEFLLCSRNSYTYTLSAKKGLKLRLLLCCLKSVFCLSFHHLCFFFVFVFVQLMKCPLGRI